MKQPMQKLGALSACALAMAMMSTPVQAENGYTPIAGTETTFDKYLILDENANVPAVTFRFAIQPGTPIAATETGMEVLAGPTGTNAPVITSGAVFTPDDTGYNTVQTGDILELAEGEKYAYKVLTADFSGVSFDEPGIYRYIISETSASINSVTVDSEAKTLDVYVIDQDGSLAIASYVLHTGTDAPVRNAAGGSGDVAAAGAAVNGKVSGFINRYQTADLMITKQVEGSQASKDKYFKFTLNISNAGAGSKIVVDTTSQAESAPLKTSATSYSAETMAEGNGATVMTCDENGTLSHDFYLKHGQIITVRELPAGAEYSLSEVNEDYVSADLNSVDSEHYAANTGTVAADDLTIGFRNTRDGIVPTGIAMSIMPYALLVILGIIGFSLTNSRRVRP